jgi:serpin B
MRCLILIALCFVVANATYFNKNRFQRLLHGYQNQYDLNDNMYGNQYDQLYGNQYSNQWVNQYGNQYGDLYGSDDVDSDYIENYADQIRRGRMCDRDQCPRDIDDILNLQDFDEYDTNEFDIYQGQDRTDRYNVLSRLDEDEHEFGSPLLKEVEDANNKLACRLYKESKEEKDDKNIVISPISIQLALAALNCGTRGNTKRQIGRIIGGRLQKNERRQVYSSLVRSLKGLHHTGISTVGRKAQIMPITGIFVSQTTPAQQMFVQIVRNTLGTTVQHCNFHQQPQQCRQMINRWMAQRTQGKISHIVPQDAITDNTKMVLVNSMQVKATWGPQMRKHITKEAKFYPLDTNKVKIVEVMETKGSFKYHEDELVKIVGVPTQQKELTLYVIVPKDKDGLTEVEKLHLQDSVQLKQLLDMTDRRVQRVGVQLPKFQIKHKIDVRRTLRKQGVTDAFDPLRADFSLLTGVSKFEQDEMVDRFSPLRSSLWERENVEDEMMSLGHTAGKLHLNKFIHQSTLTIAENGITATTGTGNEIDEVEHFRRSRFGGLSGLGGWESENLNMFDEITGFNLRESTISQKIVKANRAFAFVVKHNPTNQLVFVGRVIDAAQKKVNNLPQTINVVDQL